MAAARVLTLCDALVSAINTAWAPTEPDTISREYIAPVNDDELNTLIGRHVYVFPGRYDNNPETRGHDAWVHEISILIIERRMDAGKDFNLWMDGLIDFVQTKVVDTIDYDGRQKLSIGSTRKVLTQSIDVDPYDPDLLNRMKIFRSQVDAILIDRDVG